MWPLVTPVPAEPSDGSLSERGYFWIGWCVGFVNALLLVGAVMLLRTLLL